jgi:hypothetical protein
LQCTTPLKLEVVWKVLRWRLHDYFSLAMIGMYLNQFHDVTIRPLVADLKRLGLNRLRARSAVRVPYRRRELTNERPNRQRSRRRRIGS